MEVSVSSDHPRTTEATLGRALVHRIRVVERMEFRKWRTRPTQGHYTTFIHFHWQNLRPSRTDPHTVPPYSPWSWRQIKEKIIGTVQCKPTEYQRHNPGEIWDNRPYMMKMNVCGQGACSNTNASWKETSVRWLGHASSVLPAATRHPVLLFFPLFPHFCFQYWKWHKTFSRPNPTPKLKVFVLPPGPKLENLKISPAQEFSKVPGLKSTHFVPKPQTSSCGTHFYFIYPFKSGLMTGSPYGVCVCVRVRVHACVCIRVSLSLSLYDIAVAWVCAPVVLLRVPVCHKPWHPRSLSLDLILFVTPSHIYIYMYIRSRLSLSHIETWRTHVSQQVSVSSLSLSCIYIRIKKTKTGGTLLSR